MPAQSHKIKQHDTLPGVEGQVVRWSGDGPYPLPSVSAVNFHLRASGAATAILTAAASIVNATNGQLSYSPIPTLVTASVGYYQAEFELVYNDGQTQTVPRNGYIPFRVYDDIA